VIFFLDGCKYLPFEWPFPSLYLWATPSITQLTVNVAIRYNYNLRVSPCYMFRPFTRPSSGQYKTL
jgi:hypothetical protein